MKQRIQVFFGALPDVRRVKLSNNFDDPAAPPGGVVTEQLYPSLAPMIAQAELAIVRNMMSSLSNVAPKASNV